MAATADVLKPDFGTQRKHFIFTEEHDRLRESIGRFVEKELQPHAEEWEETTFPDSVFHRMGELGFLGLSVEERYGGQGGDYYANLVLAEEITKANSGGLAMGVAVHTDMAMPPILAFGTEEHKQEWVVPAIKGEKILCLGITEPDAGSDVAGIKTRAVRDGDDYVINGSKTYITNGHRADVIVLVTKTGDAGTYDEHPRGHDPRPVTSSSRSRATNVLWNARRIPRSSSERSKSPAIPPRGSYSTTSRYTKPSPAGSKWRSCRASGRPRCVLVYVTSRFGSKAVIVIVSSRSRPSSRVDSRAVSPTAPQLEPSSRRTYPGQYFDQLAVSVMKAKPRSTATS